MRNDLSKQPHNFPVSNAPAGEFTSRKLCEDRVSANTVGKHTSKEGPGRVGQFEAMLLVSWPLGL